jgi:hypothetical protein
MGWFVNSAYIRSMEIIGLDPGARYTGVCVRNFATDEILLSSTYVRPVEIDIVEWARYLADKIMEDVVSLYPGAQIGLEGISAPGGFKNGKKAPINPKYIIEAGIVMGCLANKFREAVIVPPGKNGSSRTPYPEVLNGRRPKTLPGISKGAGTRNHEKSAYDVAGEVPFIVANNLKK